jgi:hypothetical protein
MSEPSKTTVGVGSVSLLAVIAAIAANLKPIAEGVMVLWNVLAAYTKGATLGMSSFFLALTLAMLSQPYLRRWLPDLRCHLSREWIIESAALAIGVGIMWGQLQTTLGALAGIVAGLLAPYLQKLVEALWNLGARALGPRT